MSDALIIILTYNEKENIERLIAEIFKQIKDVDILIVDDNSPDGTGRIADEIAALDNRVSVMHRTLNRGEGFACVDAFREALKREGVRYIIEMDADLSHDPIYILRFLEEIKKDDNDVVIGSRLIKGGRDTERNFLRSLLSVVASFFIRNYLSINVNDCTSRYRCFKRHVIASLDLDSLISKGPSIIEEILYLSNLKRFRIKEIPIAFKDRDKGRTKLGLKKLLKVFVGILVFKRMHSSKTRGKHINQMREFGFRFALALNILGFIMFYRGRGHFIWFTGIGTLNLIFAIVYPRGLRPFKKILDAMVFCFGWMVNMISMSLAFYLLFAPIGILLRLFRKDLLSQDIDKNAASYWVKRRQGIFSKESYERMG